MPDSPLLETSKKPAPKVSVIVPNYNHARYLRQRIDSILAQTFQDFELILLDDASTDDSRDVLSPYSSDPHVRAIEANQTNSGSGFKQWNKGVRLARGEYIWIAESDDYAEPTLLERLVPVLDNEPKVVYAYCRSRRVSADCELSGFVDYYLKPFDRSRWTADYRADGREECRNFFARVNCVPNASAVLFRKAVFDQVGGADETLRLCGDWKLWAAMALTGEVAYIGEPLNYFRFHDESVRSKTQASRANLAESFEVMSWVFRHVTPPEHILEKMYKWQPRAWVPVLMSSHVSLDIKRRILRSVRQIDPHPIRHGIPPALNTMRLKLLRHWRDFTYPMKCARELWAWWRCKTQRSIGVDRLTTSIDALGTLIAEPPEETHPEAPIFLLSAGMRTGSTLLQRILVTDPRLLIWGEPMGEMNITARLAQILTDLVSPPFLESWRHQPSPTWPELAKSWIAHLNPAARNFRLGLRSLFDTWLGKPARQNGFARWGFKEVRLDASAAVLLQWLYPEAKFILLVRHPFDCYRSFADTGWENPSFVQFPDYVVNSAASFAREWNRIATSWSELPADFPSRLIKYEDLTSGSFDFRALESWLGLKLNESEALSKKVGRTAFRKGLHHYERWIVSREAAPGMRLLGYSKRTTKPAKTIPKQQPEPAIAEQKSA